MLTVVSRGVRRSRGLTAIALIVVVAACGGSSDSGGSARGSAAPVAATPSTDPYPGVRDVTCAQLEDAYTGKIDLGMDPNDWAGQLLAYLVRADGITKPINGKHQRAFAVDLAGACYQEDVPRKSARAVGAAMYGANPQRYQPTD